MAACSRIAASLLPPMIVMLALALVALTPPPVPLIRAQLRPYSPAQFGNLSLF